VGPLGIALVFLIVWWVVWFMVLPWGVKPPATPEPGHATSAPERPMLVRKLLITTAIALVITGAIAGVVELGWLGLEDFGA
jgi:predicted secreted protein